MEWVETTGRTVAEAMDLALDRLGVDEADAEFEVVEEPRPGLFGRLRGEARVRARVKPTRPRPKVERRERRRRNGAKSGAISPDGAPPATGDEEMVVDDDAAPTATGGDGGPVVEGASSGEAAAEFLSGLAEAFGVEATTEIVAMDDDVEVRLHGDDLGLLIGPRGQTLQAVQDLTRIAVQRHDEDRHGRLRIDIAGYRERRREALARFTEQVASQVVASGEARALEPMTAADRKVVHDVAATLAGVSTRSEGEDPFRRVVIFPADA
jgi:spoIIIJ-associated protein